MNHTATPNEAYEASLATLGRSTEECSILREIHDAIAHRIAQKQSGQDTLIVGIAGSQGSGKSTHSALLCLLLEQRYNLKTCTLSIDDVYLSRAERMSLAERIHPLFKTRGVPGTHDVDLALSTLEALKAVTSTTQVMLPRFDKATDEPVPTREWPEVEGPIDVILFEGWCVGAPLESEAALVQSVNRLEAQEDPDGTWRRHVNTQLGGAYRTLFAQLDLLILLAAPSFEVVFGWRQLQENKLRVLTASEAGPQIMDDTALERFIMHYERITNVMLAELPARADCVVALSKDQQPTSIRWKNET